MSKLNKQQKRTLRKLRDLMILGDMVICGEGLRIYIENIELEITESSTIDERTVGRLMEER